MKSILFILLISVGLCYGMTDLGGMSDDPAVCDDPSNPACYE